MWIELVSIDHNITTIYDNNTGVGAYESYKLGLLNEITLNVLQRDVVACNAPEEFWLYTNPSNFAATSTGNGIATGKTTTLKGLRDLLAKASSINCTC